MENEDFKLTMQPRKDIYEELNDRVDKLEEEIIRLEQKGLLSTKQITLYKILMFVLFISVVLNIIRLFI